jgi:hypothetical protein
MNAYESPAALPPHVLHRADVLVALQQHDFGTVFALARKWGGISYSKIADACDIKPERVGRLAKGEGSITTYEKIAQITDALRVPGHLVGLAPREWEADAPSRPFNSASEPARPATPVDGIDSDPNGDDPVLRRDFSRTSLAGAGLFIGLPDLAQIPTGRHIGADIPSRLRKRTARLRRLDDVLGGADTYRVYLGEYQSTKAMLREGRYTEATGCELLSVLAEQAQQAGWAAFDAGSHADAKRLYEAGYQAAIEAGDAPLAGNALAFLAYQNIEADCGAAVRTAVESCRTAGSDAPGRVQALLYERLAWAHAAAGDAAETERALGIAEIALARAANTPNPAWTAWVDRDELQIMTGRCWTALRRPLRAVPVLEQVLAGFDDTHARDKALYLSWLAESYLSAGEIEQAATVTGRVLDLSAGVASVRPRRRIAPILRQLTAHRGLPQVAAVLDKVHA